MKKISIVIVTYNSEKDIYSCLNSVITNSDIPLEELEIIIVDNNSKQADCMFAKIHEKYGNDIILIKNEKNGGYGQGNNVGIRRASAPIILIMNPDVRLEKPSFKKVINRFKKDPKLSMYGMKQLLDDSTYSSNSFCASKMMNGYLSTFLTGFCNKKDIYIPQWMHFSGSCFYIRKRMFEAIGLFDESIFMYGEEHDIQQRMKNKFGAHFFYDKNITYKHLTLERVTTEETEDKMLKSIIKVNEKFGFSKEKTIKVKIQNINVLLAREILRKYMHCSYSQEKINLFRSYKQHIKSFL